MKREITPRGVVISLLGFILLWTVVTDAWGYSSYLFPLDIGTYFYGYISRFFWVLSAFFLNVTNEKCLLLHRKELFSRPRFNCQFIVVLLTVLFKTLPNRKAVAISTLLWGILTCWLLKNSRTLWNPILAHFVYDFLLTILVGGN